jgi:hypothetical protein
MIFIICTLHQKCYDDQIQENKCYIQHADGKISTQFSRKKMKSELDIVGRMELKMGLKQLESEICGLDLGG